MVIMNSAIGRGRYSTESTIVIFLQDEFFAVCSPADNTNAVPRNLVSSVEYRGGNTLEILFVLPVIGGEVIGICECLYLISVRLFDSDWLELVPRGADCPFN